MHGHRLRRIAAAGGGAVLLAGLAAGAMRQPLATGAKVERAGGEEEEVDRAQLVVVRLVEDRCQVSVDSSGALLHRRGLRPRPRS